MNVTLVVAFLAALGAWHLFRPKDKGSQAVPAAVKPAASDTERSRALEEALMSLKGEITTLKREHEQLTRSLRALEATLNRSSLSGVQSNLWSDAPEEGAVLQPEEQERAEEEQIGATLAELDQRLGKESDDPSWSQTTAMAITTFLNSHEMEGSTVLTAECQSTLCRVELEHADANAQNRLMDHLPMQPPFDGESLFHRIDDEASAPRTLLYLARSGYPLLALTPDAIGQ